jgi:alkylation response protein AidB-like acyl-CoA dehydrogenase
LRVSVGKLGGSAMATESECIEYARECVRLAGLTDDPDIRDRLLEIARDWMAAAMGEDEAAAPSISASESLSNEAA